MQETAINWTDLTWNPASGCTKVSAECKHCYAETLAENKPHKLDEPRRVRRPSLIFTNSMSDMFHADIPDSYRDQVFAAIERSPHHRYQMLTKRPERAAAYFRMRKVPDCVWLGVTVGIQETVERVDIQLPGRIAMVSRHPSPPSSTAAAARRRRSKSRTLRQACTPSTFGSRRIGP